MIVYPLKKKNFFLKQGNKIEKIELRKENRENRCKNFNTPIDEGIKQSFKLVKICEICVRT